MTDAPEKIWAWIDLSPTAYERGEVEGEWSGSKFSEEGDEVSYTRTDLADANERVAYLRGLEDAAARCEEIEKSADEADEQMAKRKLPGVVVRLDGFEFAAEIRALAKEDGE